MNLSSLLLRLCLLSPCLGVVTANAEWLKLAENKRGNSFYIETDSVQLDSDKRMVLELIDYKKPDRDGDRKSTRLNSSHVSESRMPSSA